MKVRKCLLSLPILLAISSALYSTKLYAAKPPQPEFVKTNAIFPLLLLSPPPEPGTEEAKAELDAIVAIQNVRTPEDVARAKSEEKMGLKSFGSIFGDWFTDENLPKLTKLMKQVDADTKYFVSDAKARFNRKRPYAEDDRIHPAVEKEDTPSFPSGHATRAIIYSRVLAQIAPEHKKELAARGLEIGWDRVVGGVHHPSDIYAGRTVGQALYHALTRSPSFQEQLAEAKAELESVAQQHSAHATSASK